MDPILILPLSSNGQSLLPNWVRELFTKIFLTFILEPEPLETLYPSTTYIEPVPTEMVKKPDFGEFFKFEEFSKIYFYFSNIF